MPLTSTQRGDRSIVVYGEGSSWQYEFPVGSSEPVLQPGSPQWRDGVEPHDGDKQTAAAKATAIVLAQQTGMISNP